MVKTRSPKTVNPDQPSPMPWFQSSTASLGLAGTANSLSDCTAFRLGPRNCGESIAATALASTALGVIALDSSVLESRLPSSAATVCALAELASVAETSFSSIRAGVKRHEYCGNISPLNPSKRKHPTSNPITTANVPGTINRFPRADAER